jgi:hypothetical protein
VPHLVLWRRAGVRKRPHLGVSTAHAI